MTRNEAIELLEKYNTHILKEGYADADFYAEHDVTALDSFLATKWAKERFPLGQFKDSRTCEHKNAIYVFDKIHKDVPNTKYCPDCGRYTDGGKVI